MTTATIIQSARFNSTDSASNAEWVTNLKVPVILNQGDSVAVSQAYVDSRLNSSGNIVIPVDTPISLTYYFYYMFPSDAANTVSPAAPTQTGDEGQYLNNSFEDNPNSLVVLIGTPGSPLEPYQGTDLNAAASGIPFPPYTNIPYVDTQGFTPINQSFACDMPLLLVENKTIANGSRAYTKTWNYTIKAGSYSPANLADILTKNMAAINPNPTTMNFTPYKQFGGNQTDPMSVNATDLNPFLAKGHNIASANYTYNPEYPDSFPIITPYADGVVQGNGLAFVSNSPEFQNDTESFAGVFANFLTDTSFNPFNFSPTINAEIQLGKPISILPCKYVAQYNVATKDLQVADNFVGVISYASPIVGASEISIEFNTDSNVFQFTYLHTPLLQLPTTAGSTEPIEVVKVVKTINLNLDLQYGVANTEPSGTVNIATCTRHSGVFFQSMEPKSFWQDIMGFDVDNITFDADYVWGANRQMNYEEFNKITTSSYVGILNNFNFTKGAPNYNNPAYTTAFSLDQKESELTYSNLLNSSRWWLEHYLINPPSVNWENTDGFNFNFQLLCSKYYEEYSSASIATNPLSAIQAPLSNIASSGHYLVSIDGYQNTKNDFINDNDIFNIKSIISNYYLSVGSFATQPFSSTAIYVHNSPIPKLINSLRIRLIEPTTMKEIAGIGPNSSIYLQINKIFSDLSVSQPG